MDVIKAKLRITEDAFVLLETAAHVCISLRTDLYSSITLCLTHSVFDIPSVLSVLSTLSVLTLSFCGFSVSLVHDGELTRTSFSKAWSQTVTQVGVWLFISYLLIAAHTHTHTHSFSVSHKHTHTHTPTHFPKGAGVVAPLVIQQPIKT